MLYRLIALFIIIFLSINVDAQDAVIVPDITGLTVPVAAAELNKAGLALGTQTNEAWTQASPVEPNQIGSQSIQPDTSVPAGTAVDVTILRSANASVIYDDNDLTLVNNTGGSVDLNTVSFRSIDGSQAAFAASRWSGELRENQCTQIWSVGRNGPKGLDECSYIQNWLVTVNNTSEHFWTQLNGVNSFVVLQNGIERTTCDAAPAGTQPLNCEFYLAGGSAAAEVTQYIALSYTPQSITIYNPSDNQWMPTSQTQIFNFNPNLTNPGASLVMGDPALYQNPETVADITRLAPGQCLMLTAGQTDGASPTENCDLVAQRDLNADIAFWLAAFEVQGVTDTERRTCPAATEGSITRCIMPR